MYTSGTTGKPKGILHTSGGYLTQAAYSHWSVFDLKPESDVYWCGADIGWITGHSYIVYGPLANRTPPSVMYEGTPNYPDEHRFFEIIERYKVTILYIAPTLIRTFMKWGEEIPAAHDLSSLRVLGSVGEPINPEAWVWYRENIGGGKAPIVDTWWQTETGALMIAPLPGVSTHQARLGHRPLPGVSPTSSTTTATRSATATAAYLVLDRTVAGDDSRHLGRPRALQGDLLGRGSPSRATTSPVTAPSSTTTATTGCSAASTTS